MKDKRKYMKWLQRSVNNSQRDPWYRFRQADGNTGELYLYGVIGDDWFDEDRTAAQFQKELAGLGDIENLTVRINSPGGMVFDGLAIYNLLQDHPAQITVKVDGVAASVASVIAMAGDQVVMADNASLMIHAPWTMTVGNVNDHEKAIEALNFHQAQTFKAYRVKGGDKVTEDLLQRWGDGDDHWLNAADAMAVGLVDEIDTAMPIAAFFTPEDNPYDHTPKQLIDSRPKETPNRDVLRGALIEARSAVRLLDKIESQAHVL